MSADFRTAFVSEHAFGVIAGVHTPSGREPVPATIRARLHPDEAEIARSGVGGATSVVADVLACSRCGGRMKIIATITDPAVVRKMLTSLGLPPRGPPIAPAKQREQAEFGGGRLRWPGVGACVSMGGWKSRSGPDCLAQGPRGDRSTRRRPRERPRLPRSVPAAVTP